MNTSELQNWCAARVRLAILAPGKPRCAQASKPFLDACWGMGRKIQTDVAAAVSVGIEQCSDGVGHTMLNRCCVQFHRRWAILWQLDPQIQTTCGCVPFCPRRQIAFSRVHGDFTARPKLGTDAVQVSDQRPAGQLGIHHALVESGGADIGGMFDTYQSVMQQTIGDHVADAHTGQQDFGETADVQHLAILI